MAATIVQPREVKMPVYMVPLASQLPTANPSPSAFLNTNTVFQAFLFAYVLVQVTICDVAEPLYLIDSDGKSSSTQSNERLAPASSISQKCWATGDLAASVA